MEKIGSINLSNPQFIFREKYGCLREFQFLRKISNLMCYVQYLEIILRMGSVNEMRRYYVTPPLIGRAYIQKDS